MTVTGPPDDYTDHLKTATHEALSSPGAKAMTRPWSPTEPARAPDYRRAYAKMHERIASQDNCITWLLVEIRTLQKRVAKLEQHKAHMTANMVRAAHERAEEIWDDLKQRDESSTPP